MTILINGHYEKAELGGNTVSVTTLITTWIESEQGSTDDEKRTRLPKLKNYLHDCVDYVQANLPSGLSRVDGYCIKDILNEIINTKISELPVESEEI